MQLILMHLEDSLTVHFSVVASAAKGFLSLES